MPAEAVSHLLFSRHQVSHQAPGNDVVHARAVHRYEATSGNASRRLGQVRGKNIKSGFNQYVAQGAIDAGSTVYMFYYVATPGSMTFTDVVTNVSLLARLA